MNLKLMPLTLSLFFTLLTPALAQQESASGSRGDGFNFLGDFSKSGQQIEIPKLSTQQIQDEIQKVLRTQSNLNIQYESLFEDGDQEAFNELQLQIMLRLDSSVNAIAEIKRMFIEGTVVYHHFQTEASVNTDRVTTERLLGSVVSSYQTVMKSEYDRILRNFNPSHNLGAYSYHYPQGDLYLYQRDAVGKLISLVNVTVGAAYSNRLDGLVTLKRTLVGEANLEGCKFVKNVLTDCGDFIPLSSNLIEVAKRCHSAACVHEVGKIAQEMLEFSLNYYQKVKFENSQVENFSLFFNPKHSILRQALSRYIEDRTHNTESSLLGSAALGLTNLFYIPTASLIDGIENFRQIKTTFNFHPTHWSDGKGRRNAPKTLMSNMTNVATQVLNQQISGR